MSPISLMVNGNLYLVISLVVLQGYYLSENVMRLSLYPTHVFLSSNTKYGWIYSLKQKVTIFPFKCCFHS